MKVSKPTYTVFEFEEIPKAKSVELIRGMQSLIRNRFKHRPGEIHSGLERAHYNSWVAKLKVTEDYEAFEKELELELDWLENLTFKKLNQLFGLKIIKRKAWF
jgi:hypothetical protein